MAFRLASMTPSPARVHSEAIRYLGHRPCWGRETYSGGLWRRDHYRQCSFCGCIHPGDMIALLAAGESELCPSGKLGKLVLWTPNPIAGDLARMGSVPGPVFDREERPMTLRDRLTAPASSNLNFQPSMAERLAGHFDRPALEPAPPMIAQRFFVEHTTDQQWAEIQAAARA